MAVESCSLYGRQEAEQKKSQARDKNIPLQSYFHDVAVLYSQHRRKAEAGDQKPELSLGSLVTNKDSVSK